MAASDDLRQTRPARELISELRQLHVSVGESSSRSIAEGIGGMSHTTVNQVLRGQRIPSWPVLAKIVSQLGGDETHFRALWNATRDMAEPVDDLPSPGSAGHDVSVFVSYAHVDDRATYDRVRTFMRDVGNTYESMTGREVKLFLDRTSIAPGEDWQDRIKLGLSSSSIFLAFISPAYIRSLNCVQEFWEYVHFLDTNSTNRLMIPLLFADEGRMEKQFRDDKVWEEASRLHRMDISGLRFEPPGSSEWLKLTQKVAERIEEVLDDIAVQAPPLGAPSEDAETEDGSALEEDFDILGRVAKLEEAVPATMRHLEGLTELINQFGQDMSVAGPMMSRAATTNEKVSIARRLGKQLDPTANDMVEVAESIRESMNVWDETVRAVLGFTRRYPRWLADHKEAREGVDAIWMMANVGIDSFSELDHIHDMFGQGRGLAAALDAPLGKAQDALRILSDVRGLFFGWREGIDSLQLL